MTHGCVKCDSYAVVAIHSSCLQAPCMSVSWRVVKSSDKRVSHHLQGIELLYAIEHVHYTDAVKHVVCRSVRLDSAV